MLAIKFNEGSVHTFDLCQTYIFGQYDSTDLIDYTFNQYKKHYEPYNYPEQRWLPVFKKSIWAISKFNPCLHAVEMQDKWIP